MNKRQFTVVDALVSLRPGAHWVMQGYDYSTLEWDKNNTSNPPSDQEIQNEMQRLTSIEPFNICKETAKQLIAATDWAVLPDVGLKNSADFVTYRGILRGLIITPVADPVWPTEPTPVWE